jgi:hypothetical protein
MSKWTLADLVGAEAAAKIEAENAKAGPRTFIVPGDHLPPYMASVILQGTTLLFAIVMGVAITFNIMTLQLLERIAAGGFTTQEEQVAALAPILRWVEMVGPVTIGTFVLCVIAYLNFVYAAARNLERAWAAGFKRTPWGAVGVSFIPLGNLVMIYQVMRDIWVGSHDPRHGALKPTPLLAAWWTLYLAGNVGTRILSRTLGGAGNDASAAATYLWIETGLLAMVLASCLLLFKIVGDIRIAQSQWTDPAVDQTAEPASLAADVA